MKSLKIWRRGLLLALISGLLTVSGLKGAPRVKIENPAALYLLAQYKLATGDTASGVELFNRALVNGHTVAPLSNTLSSCNASPVVATP